VTASLSTPGIVTTRVSEWFARELDHVVPPLEFDLIGGGNSNITYRVTDAHGRQFVLRRPPLSQVLPTAHDMRREYRVLSALSSTDVPVPAPLAFCEDEHVTDAPFYVMEYVDGAVIHDLTAARSALSETSRATLGDELIDVLADIHSVPVTPSGLDGYGRRSGYVERQLRRWMNQWQESSTRPLPEIQAVHAELLRLVPSEMDATLIHGDFGIHNVLVDHQGHIRAVLDWELSTLGDPRADLGQLIARWTPLSPEFGPIEPPASTLPGFPSAEHLVRRYGERSPDGIVAIDYFVALAYWKLACIAGGVYARFRGGAMATEHANVEELWAMTVGNAAAAAMKVETLKG
jgi:aminoglycoside phosphotransferase (APT) family kinase protein